MINRYVIGSGNMRAAGAVRGRDDISVAIPEAPCQDYGAYYAHCGFGSGELELKGCRDGID